MGQHHALSVTTTPMVCRSHHRMNAVSDLRWLRRRPQYLAAWLQWRNDPLRGPFLIAAAVALGVFSFLILHYDVLTFLAGNLFSVFAGSCLLFFLTTARRRSSLQHRSGRSWVTALPSAASLTERVVATPLSMAMLLAFATCLIGLVGGLRWHALLPRGRRRAPGKPAPVLDEGLQ